MKTIEPFKYNGKRYNVGDEAPSDVPELVAAGLVSDEPIEQDSTEGADETGGEMILPGDEAGDGIVDAETDIGIDEAPGEKAPDTGEKFRVEHRGSGRWYIIDTEGKAVSEAMTKVHAVALADEMNAAG